MLSVDAVPATTLEEEPDEDVVLVATEAAEAVVVEPVLEVVFVVVPFWDIASCVKSACDFAAVGLTENTIPLPQWPVCLQYIPELSD